MKKSPYDPKSYPMTITIMPSHDLRQKTRVTVNSLEEIVNLQKQRYEVSYD